MQFTNNTKDVNFEEFIKPYVTNIQNIPEILKNTEKLQTLIKGMCEYTLQFKDAKLIACERYHKGMNSADGLSNFVTTIFSINPEKTAKLLSEHYQIFLTRMEDTAAFRETVLQCCLAEQGKYAPTILSNVELKHVILNDYSQEERQQLEQAFNWTRTPTCGMH